MTAVGGGSFSSPVTVSLRQSSDDSDYDGSKESSEDGASPAAVIALTVLMSIFLLFSLILTSVLVYMCWYGPCSSIMTVLCFSLMHHPGK